MSSILQNNEENIITRDEMITNATGFIIAGSESPAVTLSAATFYVLRDRDIIQRLNSEIRRAFNSEEQITIAAVSNLPYLHAVLEEALRIHQPAPTHLPRVVPLGGRKISGHWIPGGVSFVRYFLRFS